MFNALRSRLWLTYALIVLLLLIMGVFGLVIALRQSPLLYRQVINQLDVANEVLVRRLEPFVDLSPDQFIPFFTDETNDASAKIALFSKNGIFLGSNLEGENLLFRNMAGQVDLQGLSEQEVSTFRDRFGNDWFFKVGSVGGEYYVLTTIAKPEYRLSTIIRDEFMGPLIQAAAIVLVLAFFISLVISNWIAFPLKRMAESAEALADGDLIEIPIEGPKEVRRLAKTFNTMSQKITASAQSQREFIANVSHEFKTPLTSIQGYAQAIQDGTVKKKEDIDKAANVIHIETNRLHRLVMDLLMLARLEAGTADMHYQPVSLKPLVDNMVDKFMIQANQQHVDLRIGNIDEVEVMGDGDRLAQVFSNLIDNALKYTPPEGNISIASGVEGGDIVFAISDSGIGIPQGDEEKIFERFYQVASSRKYGKKKGFGLGLSIAREIIQSHHGNIWAEANPGKGSTFYVRLPIFMDEG